MSRKAVISFSIIAFIIVLVGVLFGTVFCVRSQSVAIIGDSPVNVSKEDILSTAGFKNGQSIFLLDKDKAINNIEAKYPYVKVVHIKTTSVTAIEIQVRARHEMCYAKFNNNYYFLDEELKVLKIIEESPEEQESNEPTHLTKIDDGVLNLNSSTMVCDFIGNDFQKETMIQLHSAMITTVTKTVPGGEGEDEVYFTRADVCEMIRHVKFEQHETYDKIIVATKHGVKLDIENPTTDLQNKINICFSTIKEFLSDPATESKAQGGTIKIYYDVENNQKCVYVA